MLQHILPVGVALCYGTSFLCDWWTRVMGSLCHLITLHLGFELSLGFVRCLAQLCLLIDYLIQFFVRALCYKSKSKECNCWVCIVLYELKRSGKD